MGERYEIIVLHQLLEKDHSSSRRISNGKSLSLNVNTSLAALLFRPMVKDEFVYSKYGPRKQEAQFPASGDKRKPARGDVSHYL
jgi:hypothetical protein